MENLDLKRFLEWLGGLGDCFGSLFVGNWVDSC